MKKMDALKESMGPILKDIEQGGRGDDKYWNDRGVEEDLEAMAEVMPGMSGMPPGLVKARIYRTDEEFESR